MSRMHRAVQGFVYVLVGAALLSVAGLLPGTTPEVRADPNAGTILARVAFNPIDNQYLVVYVNQPGGGTAGGLKGVLLGADGITVVKAEFDIATDFVSPVDNNFDPNPPAVAFDRSTKRYLAVWTHVSGQDVIVGRLIAADGTVLSDGVTDVTGNETVDLDDGILISENTEIDAKLYPAVAADPGNGRFLVTWADDRAGDFDVLGRLVKASDGTLVSNSAVDDLNVSGDFDPQDAIVIAGAATDAVTPAAAFDPVRKRFLVTWRETFAGSYLAVDRATGTSAKAQHVDFSRIEGMTVAAGTVYGVRTNSTPNQLVSVDLDTGAETLVKTLENSYAFVHGLAYRAANDTFYLVDAGSSFGVKGDLITVGRTSGTQTTLRDGLNFPGGLAYDPNNSKLYGVDSDTNGKNKLFVIDPVTGITTSVGTLSLANLRITGLAYDDVSNVLYAIDKTPNPDRLVTISTSDATTAAVGTNLGSNVATTDNVAGLAFNPDGNFDAGTTPNDEVLYAVASTSTGDKLLEIDPSAGTATVVAGTTLPSGGDFESILGLAFDQSTGTLYGVETNNDHLVELNIGTPGSSSVIGTLGAGGRVVGLAFIGSTLYGVDNTTRMLETIDTSTGAATEVALTGFANIEGLAYNSVDGFLYGTDRGEERLIRINVDTGQATPVGASGASGFFGVISLAFVPDPNGDGSTADATLYGVNTNTDQLVRFNLADSTATAIGGTDALVYDVVGGLGYDTVSGTLYAVTTTADWEIPGRILSADGTRYDADPGVLPDLTDATQAFFVSSAFSNQALPTIAYDSRRGRFLVTFTDNRDTTERIDWDGDLQIDTDIYGELVDGDGHLVKPAGGVVTDPRQPELNHAITTVNPDQYDSAVVYDPVGDTFWVSLTNDNGASTKVNTVSTNAGTLALGTLAELKPGVSQIEEIAWLAYNPYCRNAFAAYTRGYTFTAVTVSIEYAPSKACAPNPGLLWPATGSGTAPRQVKPLTAASGATATFAVDYVSKPGNTAPTTRELWIDLDGDGTYAAPVTGASTAPLAPRVAGGGLPPGAAPLAAMGLGALLLAALRARRPRRLAPALVAFSLVLALGALTSLVITGCGGGGGGGGGEAPAEEPPPPGTPGADTDAGDGLSIAEGSSATFTLVLASAPAAAVSVALSSSDTTEGTVEPATVTFTADNWDTPQTVTVTGVQDNVIDGSQQFTIVTGAVESTDTVYAGFDPPDVDVTTTDSGFQERYTMSVDDAASATLHDGTYSNGERYKVAVAIGGAARTLPYKFVFSDGTRNAGGDPALARMLTVTAAP